MKRITATQAARRFSDLLNRIRYAGDSFLVERNGEPICRMDPVGTRPKATVADLAEFLEHADWPDAGFADDLEKIQRGQPRLPKSPWDS